MVKAHKVRELGVYLSVWKYVRLRNQVFHHRDEYLVSFMLKNWIRFALVELDYEPSYTTNKFGIWVRVSWVTELKNVQGSGYWTKLNHLCKIDILNMWRARLENRDQAHKKKCLKQALKRKVQFHWCKGDCTKFEHYIKIKYKKSKQ